MNQLPPHLGLAFAHMKMGNIKQSQKRFQAVMEMEAPEDPRGLAKNALLEIAPWTQGKEPKTKTESDLMKMLSQGIVFNFGHEPYLRISDVLRIGGEV